mmetsp:Transcript_37693/g.74169  ORF Transcript_37693/g.74169 Transcript_37693/m.74169 type:complete len:321 (-) Transcript_37693:282-1244(-)
MWVGSESASFDNSLNVLSILSYPTLAAPLWVSPLQQVWKMTKVLTSAVDKVLPPGGMNVAGVLGHVGAVLELADQIFQKHMMPAPNCIFLPMGSGCTTTGLVTGIAMARVLGLGFSSLQSFKIHATPIHHLSDTFLGSVIFKKIISKVARDTARTLAKFGAPDCTQELEKVLDCLVIVRGYADHYGKMTKQGQSAKDIFQAGSFPTHTSSSPARSVPWLCSTFTSKSGAALLDFFRAHDQVAEASPGTPEPVVLFWCTKSHTQPSQKLDRMMKREVELPRKARSWLARGGVFQEANNRLAGMRAIRNNLNEKALACLNLE